MPLSGMSNGDQGTSPSKEDELGTSEVSFYSYICLSDFVLKIHGIMVLIVDELIQ
jgi:hypothetical protein